MFLELVEFKAKTASVLPFFIGLVFSWYNYQSVHIGYVFIYFVAMFIFNMAVDMLDNYNDYHHATDLHDYREKTNIIGRENISLKLVKNLMIGMIVISALLGIGLSMIVGWPLLIMGIYCYLIGIFYSSGPKPLSSLPLGEFFSGITMGFMISLICVYINTYSFFTWDYKTISAIFLIALPNTLWIANLMLANNICDLQEDELNHRYTLVHYLGRKNSLKLFVSLNCFALLAILISPFVKVAPMTVLLTFLILPIIIKQINLFIKKQVKTETFICAVKILALGSLAQVISYFIGIFLS